jgi:hypothetical protein
MIKPLLPFLLFIALITSCNKPKTELISGGNWNPNLAIPIGYSDFDIYDILKNHENNEIVIINSAGEVALNYDGEISSIKASDVLQLPDQNISVYGANISTLGIVAVPNFSQTFQTTITTPVLLNFPNSASISTILLESGSLEIDLSTNLKHDVEFQLTFPSIKINGTPVTKTITSNYLGSTPHGSTATVSLNNALVDLTDNNTTTNTLKVTAILKIVGTGNQILGNETINLDLKLKNLAYENVTGYFGQETLSTALDSVLIRIFNSTTAGTFQLTNPKLNFSVINSFGIPLELSINNLKTINVITNQITPISNSNLNAIAISAPLNVGDSTVTNLPQINNSNTTNFNSLINNTPKYLTYSAGVITNPIGQTGTLNHISKNSQLKLKANFELPLEGFAYDFEIKDTLNFNFAENTDQVEQVLFRLISSNGFPMNLLIAGEFVDQNYNPLIDFIGGEKELIGAAQVDNTGRVSSANSKIIDILFDKTKINLLKNAKYVILKATAATTQPQTQVVKIYDDYKLLLKLGMQVKIKQKF